MTVVLAACAAGSNDADAPSDSPLETAPVATGVDGSVSCNVSLHGKGGDGAPTTSQDGIARLAPRGNDEAWGGWQWDYTDEDGYLAATALVSDSIDDAGCSSVAIHGFSNGGAFAAKLLCLGETFGDRLVGVVIDDPVADAATVDCEPARTVDATLYWTGALESDAPTGTDCGPIDYTCEGGAVVGIESFAAAAGLDIEPSPFDEHRRFDDAPDPAIWLDAGAG